MGDKVKKTDAEWRAELDPATYAITRECGTERAFTGKYWATKTPGTYLCACCGEELFSSDSKFDSGSGWPSFDAPVGETKVEELADTTYGMRRTEIRCARCGSHLGHVFDDGPTSTGLRYCVNSASLALKPKA
jgi:peptide-methionine (R)-S-oxide reductase